MKAIVTSIRLERGGDVAHVRRTARTAAATAGAMPRNQIRFATAVSEIARNALQYADGGIVEFSFEQDGRVSCLIARIQDQGAGIPHIETIMQDRGTSPSGPGLGLNGSRKLVDRFEVKTGPGGTVVQLAIHLPTMDTPVALAEKAADALVHLAENNPVAELEEQNRALRDSLAEQEFLLRELHHRTKNNLAIIQSFATLQARSATSGEARAALVSLTGRIQAFANAHSYLYRADDVSQIDLKEHVLGLADRLRAAIATSRAQITCDVDQMYVPLDVATELALVINEIVTNAAKHAFATRPDGGRIRIAAHHNDGSLRLTISDDGPGLADAEERLRNSKSLGWRIVEASARKLNACLGVSGESGLTVTLDIPDVQRSRN